MSETTLFRRFAGASALALRRKRPARRLPWLAVLPTDIGLFLKSAQTDARIAHVRRREGCRAAFESAYRESDDPWASASPHYRYQGLKYEKLVALLPSSDKKDEAGQSLASAERQLLLAEAQMAMALG